MLFIKPKKDDQKRSLNASVETFYTIPGAPGEGLKPPDYLKQFKMFIHSLSQGSRCLKMGTYLLYETEVNIIESVLIVCVQCIMIKSSSFHNI